MCLSSRFSYLNFKECALGCGSSRFLCAISFNSNKLSRLWTWRVVNGKNVSIFDNLYLDASELSSLYYSKLRLLLRVTIHYLVYIWFPYFVIIILSYFFFFFYLFFSFICSIWWVFIGSLILSHIGFFFFFFKYLCFEFGKKKSNYVFGSSSFSYLLMIILIRINVLKSYCIMLCMILCMTWYMT